MALQRGGDQVVVKNETGTFFFGGRTKSQQKRSGGHSRVIATKLCSMIQSAPNVIVMGHSNPDFDSIGACVGIAALSMHLGVKVKIVTDLENENFKACTARLRELADYKNMFVDDVTGLAQSEFGTLLIIVDANNFRILEAPEIANNSFKTAVIDHHIKKEEFEHEPQLSYIDPSASSACELISEILEFSIPVGTLRKEEANVIMSGIMVDTQNFTRTVGTRTFAAALYLRSAGASPEYARTFFEQAFEDYHTEATFGRNAQIYRDQIAITVSEGTGSQSDRVAAAKAADRLLAVRNVNAAFALVLIGNTVHISGRSNGSINVQIILEKIGGGGHFDVAGAAIEESGIEQAKARLMDAIDEYFKDISASKK
jgi:c-di-AMP phosphodiesterase-like protein